MINVYFRYPRGESENKDYPGGVIIEAWPEGAGERADGSFDYELLEAHTVFLVIESRATFAKIWRMIRVLAGSGGGVNVISCYASDHVVDLP